MLKSLTVILACFLSNLGSPYLTSIIPSPEATATDWALEALQESAALEAMMVVSTSPSQVYHIPLGQAMRLNPKLKASIERLIRKYAKRHGVDEALVRAVLRQESGGNPTAVSPKGAMGLMQLMPETAALMGVENPFDPEENLAGGVKYLKLCLNSFQQDKVLALAAYNAGPGAVKKHGGVPPYRETQEYVASILGGGSDSKVTEKAAKVAVVKRIQPEEVKPQSPQETGLDWRLPRPTWNVCKAVVKIPKPKWKVCPSTAQLNSLEPKKAITETGIGSLKDSVSR